MTSLRALPRYAFLLLGLLIVATSFEGFDTKLASFLIPQLGDEFGVEQDALGFVLAWIQAGTIAAFFVVRLADRFGRKPVLVTSLAGYGLLTFATFFAHDLALYTALQAGARMLMVTQLAVAYIMLSEETPGDLRGRANALLGASASVGAVLPALFLAPLEDSSLGWRGLFLLGSLPILLVPIFMARVRETRAYREGTYEPADTDIRAQFQLLFGGALRRRSLAVASLWFTLNFWASAVTFFFFLYVRDERGWTADDLQLVVPATVPFAAVGYIASGFIMDTFGRRPTAIGLLLLSTATAITCYQATSWWTIAGCWALIQGLQGVWPVVQTITAEIFPTEVRAAGTGLTSNLLGKWGMVVGPPVTGALGFALGSTGDAVALLALTNLVAVAIVYFAIPETKGVDLRVRA